MVEEDEEAIRDRETKETLARVDELWRLFPFINRYLRVDHLDLLWMMIFHFIFLGCTLGWILWMLGL